MKKGYIIMAVFFLVFVGGIYGVFVQYVVPMRQELTSLQETEAEILDKIQEMSDDFAGSIPEQYIQELNSQKRPWRLAVEQRTGYFELEEIEPIEMPEGVIPRFWYREEFPKLEDSVYQLAAERGIQLTNFDFGAKRPAAFGAGTNPSREEILEEINKYNYGIEMVKFIMDADPKIIKRVTLWPEREAYAGRSGKVVYRTTGYELAILWEDLMLFLQQLSARENYITVEAMKVSDKTLRNPRDPSDALLIITEAQFVPYQSGVAGTNGQGGGASSFGGNNIFVPNLGRNRESDNDEEPEDSGGIIGFLKGLVGL